MNEINFMVSQILVIGATGKVGYEVVKCLSTQKVPVRAAVHRPQNAFMLTDLGVEIVPLNIDQPETIKEAFAQVKKLFLMIPPSDTSSEILTAKRLIDYAKQIGVENIIHLSAMNAEKYLTFSNGHVEQYLNDQNILHLHLHPNFFMQNFNTFYLDHIRQKNLVNFYDADRPTSFIDIRDIGAVAAKLLLEKGYPCRTFTLTGPTALAHSQVADILSSVSYQKIQYTAKSDDDTRAALRDCQWSEEGIEKFLLLFKGIQQGEFSPISSHVADILGRSPISFQQYAEDYQKFWR